MNAPLNVPATAPDILTAGGEAAGRLLASASLRRGASLLSYEEITAMAVLIANCGLAIPPARRGGADGAAARREAL